MPQEQQNPLPDDADGLLVTVTVWPLLSETTSCGLSFHPAAQVIRARLEEGPASSLSRWLGMFRALIRFLPQAICHLRP